MYARYVHEGTPRSRANPFLERAAKQNPSGLLRIYRRAVGSHFLRTTHQIATRNVSRATARLLRGI